jgi:hypothetical protein
MEMNHDTNYRERFAKLGAYFICRAANLHGQELESLTAMLAPYFTRKREWGFSEAGDWAPWFQDKPNPECLS